MKKTILAMALLLLAGSVGLAQPGLGTATKEKKSDLAAKVPVDKKVRIGHLDNGFTYYIRANKKPENRVQFRLVSNAGSVLENENQRGLAHFGEHMAFNGIKGYPHNTMIQKLQEHGIEFGREINAYTHFEQTVYHVNMPADDPEMMQMGFEILDGWAGNILFDQKEIESERGVVHEEWRGNIGHGDRLLRKTLPIVMKGSMYAERLPIGKEEVIMNFKRQEIVDFFNDWYRPDLQAIVIVGDFDNYEYAGKKGVNAIEQKVRDVFGAHPAAVNPKPRPNFTIPGNKEPLIAIATDKEATSTSFMMMWKHAKAPQGTVGDYRQALVRNLAAMMINDRLSEVCEKASAPMMYAATYYGSFYSISRDIDAFNVVAGPKEGRIGETAELLLQMMKQVDEHGFLQTELDRQKEEMIASFTKSAKEADKTHNNSHADEYTRNFLEGEVIPGIRQEWKYAKEFVPEISLEECNAVVRDWITDENMIFYLTANDQTPVPTEAEALAIINRSKTVKTEPWVDTYKDEPLFTQELPAVEPTPTKTNTVLDYTEYTCPNGIRFVVKKTEYKADEIQFNSFSMGGTSLYDDETCFQAQNAAEFVDAAGIANFSASQLEKKLKGKTLGISPSIGTYTQGFSGSCSPQDLETTLQLLNLYYTAPRKDRETYDRLIEATVQQLKFIADNPQVAFAVTYSETAYPNNKRLVLLPTEDQVKSLDLDRMYTIFRDRFADASNTTFFFVGNISDNDILLIAKYLNNLPCKDPSANKKYVDRDPKFAEGIVHTEVKKGIEKQSIVRIMGHHDGFDDSPINRLAIEALGQALQITTTEIVREKLGIAYSPGADADYDLFPNKETSWQFYVGCDPDNIAAVEKACLKIIKQYAKKGPDAKTLAKVKEQMKANRSNSRQNNGFWLGQLYYSYFFGESRDHIERYNEMVDSLTTKQLKELAKRYLSLDNYVVVSLRPEDGAVGTAD